MTLELIDAGSGGGSSLGSAYADCYRACRDAGGSISDCQVRCDPGFTGQTGVPRYEGGGDFWDSFVNGFEIPEEVRNLPGTIGGIARDVISPINTTLALAIGAGLVFLWLRRGS